MKGVNTLIRLAKRSLDELRKKQVALETEKAKLETAIKNLSHQMHAEMALAARSPEMGNFYGDFAKRIKLKQQEIHEEVKKLDAQLIALSGEIMIAFADLKKYEIARDNAKAREKAEEARRETIMMDEVAAVQFVRKDSNS